MKHGRPVKLARRTGHALWYTDGPHGQKTLVALAAGLNRYVRRREDLLDKEVSRCGLACHFLRRPHRTASSATAGGRWGRRDERRSSLDGLAGQCDLCGARVAVLVGRDRRPG